LCLCAAVIYEALMTVVSIHPDDALLSLASKCIGRFLSAKSANLQYIGSVVSSVVIAANQLLLFDIDICICTRHVTEYCVLL